SLQPYMPGARDFEQRLPAPSRLAEPVGEENARWLSPAVEAPHRFDLVGIAGEMRPVEIRAREGEGAWSDWVETHDGTPVYVDGADQVQVRAAFRPSGDLHYVNVSGTAGSAGERLLNTARGAINSALISIAATEPAQALAPQPSIIPRSGWGADLADGGCPPGAPPEYGEVRAAVIHHTVNANDYAPEQAAGIVLGICRFHRYGNGWNDIGYNALVDRFGNIYEGRAGGLTAPVLGAQAQGFNAQTTSIASIGEHGSYGLTPEAQRGVVRFLAWKLGIHALKPATGTNVLTSAGGPLSRYAAGVPITAPRILGHGDLGVTECPGAALNAQIATIREAVQKRIKKYSTKKCNKKKKKGCKRKRNAKR
ncbi:MAG: N-acetylmuramoyl-L-alanine amidase, partial [Actinomycetota bacterium]|nr:N-acetylmuramoyl-L-alanine amidase [Actinomycetota bacterium]